MLDDLIVHGIAKRIKQYKRSNTMLEHDGYALKQIQQIFKMDTKVKSKQTIFNAEERGEIPRAPRVPRGGSGKVEVRKWTTDQLPEIGKRFGFLSYDLITPEIISIFTQKGGTLKSTLTFSIGRILALNGVRVLIIGLDTQGSVTTTTVGEIQVESLEEFKKQKDQWGGLYHLLFQDGIELDDIVKRTNLPTLDIIPETGELAELERRLQGADGREAFFKRKLMPLVKGYDVIIFDNSPSWSQLVKASLYCADTVISPLACNLGTYEVLDTNMATVSEYLKNLNIHWRNFLMIPTLLEKTKLSQQIYAAYLANYPESVVPNPIRRTVIGEEASYLRRSVIEYDPTSPLASDYYDMVSTVWKRIIDGQKLAFAKTQGGA